MSNIDKQALRKLAVDAKELAIIKRYTKGIEAQKKFIAAANPATVLALLDELEAAEHTAAVDHEAACSLVEENEELKRRIAELEAREINLPPYSFFDFKQGSPFKHGAYCHLDAVNAELAKHGIKIVAAAGIGKGE